MTIYVKIIGADEKKYEINIDKIIVKDLLKKLGLSSSEYIVLRNNTIVTEEDVIVDNDELTIYPVKSGG